MFGGTEDVMKYYLSNDLHIKDRILLRNLDGTCTLTTAGRVVFNSLLPEKI